MRVGPSIECQGCGLLVLLAFAERVDGVHRRLTCPCCRHEHLWSTVDVRTPAGGSQRSLGSSVE
jgi:hypothetical protein